MPFKSSPVLPPTSTMTHAPGKSTCRSSISDCAIFDQVEPHSPITACSIPQPALPCRSTKMELQAVLFLNLLNSLAERLKAGGLCFDPLVLRRGCHCSSRFFCMWRDTRLHNAG